jgi:2-isopropylmalate synthase
MTELTAAEGEGPVNALDLALRKALSKFFPEVAEMRLSDFKVRIIDGADATAAQTRVLVDSTARGEAWTTVGVSENIIEASWQALLDSVEYYLMKQTGKKQG